MAQDECARCWSELDGRELAAQWYRRAVPIETDYKGFRIEVDAELEDGARNAEVRSRRTLSEMMPHVLSSSRAASRRRRSQRSVN